MSPDQELLRAYAAERSERAFRALVERHVGLVYSTALRQLGDRMLAEEITQNVFIALARKPEAFRHESTIAGWLYKTTLLQARQCIRSELRRKRREAVAVELGTSRSDAPEGRDLVPLLDEALLSLREKDRLAIVLRFFEEKPLRAVGQTLGVSEDAAQKRVAKALETLSQFFRRRGFTVSAVALGALAAKEASAAPAGLGLSIAQTAVREAALAPVPGFALFLTKLMTMTKTQTAVICLMVAAIPLALQWHLLRGAQAHAAKVRDELEFARAEWSEADAALSQLKEQRAIADASREILHARSDSSAAGQNSGTGEVSAWSDKSYYARIPKSVLADLDLGPGLGIVFSYPPLTLTDQLFLVLQATPEQQDQLTRGLTDALERYHAVRSLHYEPTEEHLVSRSFQGGSGQPIEQISFRQLAFPQEGDQLRAEVDALLQNVLGEERRALVWKHAGPGLETRFGRFGTLEKHFTLRLEKNSISIAQTTSSSSGAVSIGSYPANHEQWAPEFAKPVLARWRAQIEQWKTENTATTGQ